MMAFVSNFIIPMLLLSILIGVHEYGHFLAARMNGVFVEVFSIGMGPVMYEWTDKKGTKIRFSWFFCGGYIRMYGDADATSVRADESLSAEAMKKSIHSKKPWQKIIVAISGPLANIIFAVVVLFSFAFFHGFPQHGNIINTTGENSWAYTSGLRNGDQIVKVGNSEIKNFSDIVPHIKNSVGKDISMEILRNKERLTVNIKLYEIIDGCMVPKHTIGIMPCANDFSSEKLSLKDAFIKSINLTYYTAASNLIGIWNIFTNLTENKNIGGIISIFNSVSKSSEQGIASFIWIMAMLSITLGTLNLLPIPVLDGGSVLISTIEWIVGRPINKKIVNIVFIIGLIVVAFLMLLGLWNDLSKFISWEKWFK